MEPGALSALMVQTGFFEGLWWQALIPPGEPTCLVIGLHGYADHCDFIMLNHAREVALRTRAIVLIFDQTGFGRSDGLWAFIPDWFRHVASCGKFIEFGKKKFPGLKTFGLGGSMGGGVLVTLAIETPNVLDGLILLSPMCGMAEHLKPHRLVQLLLRVVCWIIPDLPITPVPDLSQFVYRESSVFPAILARNRLNYILRPRLATAWELVRAQEWIKANMERLKTPFLVIHGSEDRVVDLACSKALAERAKADDKRLEVLEGYAHCLMGAGQAREFNSRPYSLISEWLTLRI
jgi:alpha-beta hydrolase superfamily lysophospholipase